MAAGGDAGYPEEPDGDSETSPILDRMDRLEGMIDTLVRMTSKGDGSDGRPPYGGRGKGRTPDFKDRGTRRLTMAAPVAGSGPTSLSRPKLAQPPIFDGKYTELYNVLNWIITVERYLYNCGVGERQYSSYAYTYLNTVVQAWFDNYFYTNPTPPWDVTTDAMRGRYLPSDHESRLIRRFLATRQRTGLTEYVDRFQVVLSALELASIKKPQVELVRQFIDGLDNREDRLTLLTREVSTINECYELILKIQGAKRTSGRDTEDGYNRKGKLNKLSGPAKDKAMKDGRCLECG